MTSNSESNNLAIDSTISIKGIVKAIFNDTIHIQIGGKVISLPASTIAPRK